MSDHSVKPFRQQRLLGPSPLWPEEVDALGVKLRRMELRRPRAFGNCWQGCGIWRLLELDDFWREKLPEGWEGVAWHKLIKLLAVNRLVDPGSEWRLHRQWFDQSARDELLAEDLAEENCLQMAILAYNWLQLMVLPPQQTYQRTQLLTNRLGSVFIAAKLVLHERWRWIRLSQTLVEKKLFGQLMERLCIQKIGGSYTSKPCRPAHRRSL